LQRIAPADLEEFVLLEIGRCVDRMFVHVLVGRRGQIGSLVLLLLKRHLSVLFALVCTAALVQALA